MDFLCGSYVADDGSFLGPYRTCTNKLLSRLIYLATQRGIPTAPSQVLLNAVGFWPGTERSLCLRSCEDSVYFFGTTACTAPPLENNCIFS